jgi:hypothetical protein
MNELLGKSFEMFRRHPVLWVPCTIAGILMLALGGLEKVEIHWVLNFFATNHSALGAAVPYSDPAHVADGAVIVTYSLGYLKQFLEICLFVVALAVTSNLVRSFVEGQSPDMAAALKDVKPQGWEVLLFAIKYMLILAVIVGFPIAGAWLSPTSNYFQKLHSSLVIFHAYSLFGEGCLAWVLVPAAIRLLRPPDSPDISAHGRKLGVLAAVTTSAASFVLQYVVGRAESPAIVAHQWERWAIAVMNMTVMTVPQAFLFIAVALLALQGSEEARSIGLKSETSWGRRDRLVRSRRSGGGASHPSEGREYARGKATLSERTRRV